jgi:pyruvate/2-oxoglutarate dehydrogenase complex dihydrolipoamide dehydrogenase (E3) component
MAQALQRLGSKVTVVQKADRLAERADPDVGDMLRQILERDGCRIYLNADVRRLEAAGAGVRVHLPAQILEGTHLFLAVGRQPNTMVSAWTSSGSRPTSGVTSPSMIGCRAL